MVTLFPFVMERAIACVIDYGIIVKRIVLYNDINLADVLTKDPFNLPSYKKLKFKLYFDNGKTTIEQTTLYDLLYNGFIERGITKIEMFVEE